jgi:hypothetical protein
MVHRLLFRRACLLTVIPPHSGRAPSPTRHASRNDTRDSWGTPYEFRCEPTPYRMRVRSAGEDRQFGTADDLGAE